MISISKPMIQFPVLILLIKLFNFESFPVPLIEVIKLALDIGLKCYEPCHGC